MKSIAGMVGGLIVLLSFGCAHRSPVADGNPIAEKFVGTTPGGALVREFVGGLASNAACDSITWGITRGID